MSVATRVAEEMDVRLGGAVGYSVRFDNVRAVMEDAGVPWKNVVDVLVFLTDMKNDFKTYNRVYAEYFAGEGNPNPARTTIEINALPTPIAVEVKVVATID